MVYTAPRRRMSISRRAALITARQRWMQASARTLERGRARGVTGPVYRSPTPPPRNVVANTAVPVAPVATIPRSILSSAQPAKWRRSRFGEGNNANRLSTFNFTPAAAFLNTKALLTLECTALEGRTTAAGEVNRRSSNMIYAAGIKIFIDFHNAVQVAPIYVEYALVSPKNGTLVNTQEFLTNTGGTARGQLIGSTKSAMQLQSEKINPDENFIFLHKRLELIHQPTTAGGHTDGDFNTKNGASYRSICEYVPLRSRISWSDMTETRANDPLWLCIWCYRFSEASDVTTASALEYEVKTVLYYRNLDTN